MEFSLADWDVWATGYFSIFINFFKERIVILVSISTLKNSLPYRFVTVLLFPSFKKDMFATTFYEANLTLTSKLNKSCTINIDYSPVSLVNKGARILMCTG